MKKNRILVGAALFVFSMCLPENVSASDGDIRVYDNYDVLTDEEEAALDEELADIYEEYGFEGVILTSEDVYEDERMYAAEFMQENDFGYGDAKDGMCIFHQPDRRLITIVFRGDAQYAFDTRIQGILLDDCTEYLKKDDPYSAYQAVLDDMKKGLPRWTAGKSVRRMDLKGGLLWYILKWFGISFLIMAVPTLIMTLYQKGKMKSVVPQSNADDYILPNSLHLDVERDIFVHTHRTRTKKPEPKDSNSGGGGSGSFTSGGESFSGSSRSY